MLTAPLVFAALLSAVNPWLQNDPFPLPATYESVLRVDKFTLNAGYRGVFENYELDGVHEQRPYEEWDFFNEVNAFARYALSDQADLKAGVRIKHDFGGEVEFLPRIAYVDDRPKHTLIFGNFRASWNPGILYQPLSADDHIGAFFRVGRSPFRWEGFVSRPQAAADHQYEQYIAAQRLRFAPGHFFFIEAQGLIDHAAGFDTMGIAYRRPTEPTHQAVQTGLYAELNFLGRNNGVHAEISRTSGSVVEAWKTYKPHGRYRAVGLHLFAFNITAIGEYRRVDPTFISPQGAFEYRQLFPRDRQRLPDALNGKIRWFYPFHTNGSVVAEVEQTFFTPRNSLKIYGHQNRTALALQVGF